MGYLTLAEMADELEEVLGARASLKATRWINRAYFDIAGAVDFHELDVREDIPTVIGEGEYSLPEGLVGLTMVYNNTQESAPRKVEIQEILRKPLTAGTPSIWSRHGDLLYLWPLPAAVEEIVVFGTREPDALAADSDLTILPKTFDTPIVMLATSYGFMAFREDAAAITWYNRALGYMQSRVVGQKVRLPATPGGQ